jgi:hypothetical protein
MSIAHIIVTCAVACITAFPQQETSRVRALPGHQATFTGRILGLGSEPIAGASICVVPDSHTLAELGFFPDLGAADVPESLRWAFGRGVSDADGKFSVTANTVLTEDPPHNPDRLDGMLQQEHPRIFVVKPGSAARTIRCAPFAGSSFDAGSVRLAPSVLVTGRVVDDDGQPIEGARIEPFGMPDRLQDAGLTEADVAFMQTRGGDPSWLLGTATGVDGRFIVDGLWPGRVRIWASSAGYLTEDRFIDVLRAAKDIGSIELKRGRVLTGFVLDPSGTAIEGAKLFVGEQLGSAFAIMDEFPDAAPLLVAHLVEPWATTDASGAFRISGLSERTTWIVADAPDLEPVRLALAPTSDQSGLVVSLPRQGTLEVLVRDARTGKPVVPELCMAWRLASNEMWKDRVELPVSPGSREDYAAAAGPTNVPRPNDDGLFHITGTGSLATDIFVTAPGYGRRLFTQPGTAVSTAVACTIELEPEAIVAGRVLDDSGVPLAGIEVEARGPLRCREDSSTGWSGLTHPPQWQEKWLKATVLPPRAVTDEQGRFELRELFTGNWTVEVIGGPQAPPNAGRGAVRVSVTAGERVEIDDIRSG